MKTNAAKVMHKAQDDEKQSGTHRVATRESERDLALSMADALSDILAYEIRRSRNEDRL